MGGGGGSGIRTDINVTPLVDVVLVLLIIFMVVTPLLEKEMPVKIPELEQQDVPPPPDLSEQIVVQIRNGGRVYINTEDVPKEALLEKLKLMQNARTDKVIFFDAEDSAVYGLAVEVLDILKQAGADPIGMMLPDPNAPVEATAAPGAPAPTPQ